VAHLWTTHPLVREPLLDGRFYLNWAGDIARGDLLGKGGVIGGEPWFFNPLYAYVLAPIVGLFSSPVLPILLVQAALGAGTAALTAAAAVRTFDRRAGWIAGLLVAFAAPLAQLDAHISVAELSAFLVAGACFACTPATAGDRPGAHGPVAAGLWLGIGALARPVVPLALPFVAWRFWRDGGRRAAVVCVLTFAACAVPSFLRNWGVSGEPAVWTAAGGANVHLGNNAKARADRTMASPDFRFGPETMHDDARRVVERSVGRRVTRGEVGSWFWRQATEEAFFRAPGESLVWYAQKARWFFGPTEVPSSASLAADRQFSPGLWAAFVPAWLLASLAAAGAWVWRRRPEVLLGPGALALAHWGMLTLVFPLSHYRAPAIPALAVLAAGAVTALWAAWSGRYLGAAATIVVVGAGAAVAGALSPQPDPLAHRDQSVLAIVARDAGDFETAERYARAAIQARRRTWPDRPDSAEAWAALGEVQMAAKKWSEAKASLDRAVELDPKFPLSRVLRSEVFERMGVYGPAEQDARDAIVLDPSLPDGFERLAALLAGLPARREEARAALAEAIRRGADPDPELRLRVGLPR
jgi:tetratricopeptide (TPR) repeat protein